MTKVEMTQKTRREAKALGLKKYFNGKACPRGHIVERYISGMCVACHKSAGDEHYRKNRENRIAYARAYAKSNPNANHKAHLKRAYGISYEEYARLLSEQNGRCGICGTDDPQCKNDRWHVDHCHATQKVRGLLCRPCNHMLGLGRDNPATLLSGIDYLNGRKASGYATASALLSFGA
jgi:hypothetical protein